LKKYFQRWSKTAHVTLITVTIIVVLSVIFGDYQLYGYDMTLIFNVILLTVIGYSFFFAAYNSAEPPPPYDRRIIKDAFDGASKYCRLFYKAYQKYLEGDFADALTEFNDIKEFELKKREKAVLSFYIGRCYQYMGYPTNASKQFRDSIDNGIGVDEVYTLCGREMVSCGDFSAAEDVYNELIKAGSDSDYIYTDMGMLYIKANDPEKALDSFSTSIRKHMNYAFAMGGCALAYVLKKDSANAKFFYGQAIINNIDDVEGFTEYYLSVAETQGLSEDIGIKPKPKLYIDPAKLTGGDD
jgi:tetratricopeptide (TPR) repeat protein